MFFPEEYEQVLAAKAKQVCRSCDIRLACLALSIETGTWEGVWGGFTERPRRAAARQHFAGKPLEVIIAEDDAAFAANAEAAPNPPPLLLSGETPVTAPGAPQRGAWPHERPPGCPRS